MITIGKIDFDALRQQVEAEFAQEQSEKQRFRWTQELTDRLIALVDEQKTVPDIAAALGVPDDKVRNKLQVLKARVPSGGQTGRLTAFWSYRRGYNALVDGGWCAARTTQF